MAEEAESDGLPVRMRLLKAPIHDRFFVKIIGRGYPPPTNSFRWCTNGLRIRPVAAHILSHKPEDTVLALGIRRGESNQRDRVIAKGSGSYWQKQQEGNKAYDLFAPIINLDTASVWDAIFGLSRPRAIKSQNLEDLYRDASGECPIIKSPQAPPCASGRFGCWTCTVVRKDKSAQKLIDSGHDELRPFINFRNWLSEIRNDPNRRWSARRSGAEGLGPFTLAARQEILGRLDRLEDETGVTLLDSEERGVIAALWTLDHVPRLASPRI
jgi:DNA sulfur modification protein DndC